MLNYECLRTYLIKSNEVREIVFKATLSQLYLVMQERELESLKITLPNGRIYQILQSSLSFCKEVIIGTYIQNKPSYNFDDSEKLKWVIEDYPIICNIMNLTPVEVDIDV